MDIAALEKEIEDLRETLRETEEVCRAIKQGEVGDDASIPDSPADRLEQSQVMGLIEQAVQGLPERQREAFMLRYWEELDVSETAKVMGCSEGSVKTHCSRATHALAKVLRAKGITL